MKTKNHIGIVKKLTEVYRRCTMCAQRGINEVLKTVNGRVDMSSRRFACDDHATPELYPERFKYKLPPLPGFIRPQYVGDMSNFYRDVVRELGGIVPMPDRDKPAKKRKKVWIPVEPINQRFVPADPIARNRSLSGKDRVIARKVRAYRMKAKKLALAKEAAQ